MGPQERPPHRLLSVPTGGLDYLVLNHIGISPFQMWDGDVEHTRWLMQVRIPSSSRGAQRFCFPGTTWRGSKANSDLWQQPRATTVCVSSPVLWRLPYSPQCSAHLCWCVQRNAWEELTSLLPSILLICPQPRAQCVLCLGRPAGEEQTFPSSYSRFCYRTRCDGWK